MQNLNGQNWKIGRQKIMLFNESAMEQPLSDDRSKYNYKSNMTKKIGVTNVVTNQCVVCVIKNYVSLESLV